ncbi:uncharacterized protein LOC108667883 [Hyalella azteca]|uniref:NADH dehydrogenase [ubiquinone] 1 beta subcomplex subunit 4 n=1 Tax=Hyalella azteca TaxID=294128 RepID=A0A8B7NA66_HYAAZ|nr:uncharacterized protein LOC108667883 [Hyalella azteca]
MSQEEELIAKRARMKAALKAQFIKQQYNPYRFINGNEPIFDPAIQRWMAMKATTNEFFRPTPKTSLIGFLNVVPIGILFYFLYTSRLEKERIYRSGQMSYRDRRFKFT